MSKSKTDQNKTNIGQCSYLNVYHIGSRSQAFVEQEAAYSCRTKLVWSERTVVPLPFWDELKRENCESKQKNDQIQSFS